MRTINVRRHKRRIKTPYGYKLVGVIEHTRKKPKPFIVNKSQAKMLDKLDDLPFEVGGYIDAEDSKMDHMVVYTGKEDSIEFVPNSDYESEFHTHPPPISKPDHFASTDDIDDFLNNSNNQQISIIQHNNHRFVLEKSNNVKYDKRLVDEINELIFSDKSKEEIFEAIKPKFKKMGINVYLYKPDEVTKFNMREV